jgi:plastocyanin/type II secretory pathway pseudopilin PulG
MWHLDRGRAVPAVRGLVLALAALVLGPATAAAQQTVTIDVFNFDFGNAMLPQHIDPVIHVGDTVRWNWVTGTHSTTSASGQLESWDSTLLSAPVPPGPAVTFDHTFTHTGTFAYFCSLHGSEGPGGTVSGMSGFVIVNPVPEPASVLLVAGLAGAGAWGYRRRGRVRAQLAATFARGRPAVTLLELLVVLALVGLLAGLMLPSVMKVRESASYISCRNNLRQIGLAIHNYESSHGFYPGLGTTPHQDSVLARVLPYLELGGLHSRIRQDQPLFIPIGDYGRLDASQAEAARAVVPLFLCPSDGRSPVFTNYDYATLAGTNYVVNAGTGTGTYYDFRYPTDGMFWYGSKTRHADVSKGLANTMFVSEALVGAGIDVYQASRSDPRRFWLSTGCMASPAPDHPGTNPPLNDQMCQMNMVGMTWRGDRNASWIGGPGHRSVFNTYMRPNDPMFDLSSWGLGWFKASSGHPGGVNMILGDGSVHFVRNDIDPATWRALSTRGEDVVGDYCGCH